MNHSFDIAYTIEGKGSEKLKLMEQTVRKLKEIVGEEYVLENELLSDHTTFHIGGAADCFVMPPYIEKLEEVLACVRQAGVPYYVMGNGSNILAKDSGYQGIVISTCLPAGTELKHTDQIPINRLSVVTAEEWRAMDSMPEEALALLTMAEERKTCVFASCGIMLSAIANAVAREGLTGFEFASGIPGTLGGAVAMNAGAYGGEIKDCILGAMVLFPDGTKRFLPKEELQLGYRSSLVQKEGLLVLWAVFAFLKGDAVRIRQTMQEWNQRRRDKQPLQYASAGSTFKRPEGYFAGRLIEDAGLRGYHVGDVMVSEKHCGFVVNVGEGTYDDARQVIEHVQQTVQEKFGVKLELEVRILE